MSEAITEFLLARIAEDEEKGRSLQGYTDYFIEEFGDRLLAECAAKRAIVEAHGSYAESVPGLTGIAAVGARCGQEVTLDALRALATVYADHPDYEQEWAA